MDLDPGLEVETAPGVYPPREDSYLLLSAIQVDPGARVLELGAGSGLVALHAAKRAHAHVVATDINPTAVGLVRQSAIKNGLPLDVIRCDLFRGLRGRFDVVAFNAPYLIEAIGDDWEARAWQGGAGGDDLLLRFLREAPEHLAPGGRAYVVLPTNRERAAAEAHARFAVTVVAEKPLFFETLQVLALSHRG